MVSVADLKRGIDALADILEYGHQLACTDPFGLLSGAASRIEELQIELNECNAAHELLREQLRKSKTEHRSVQDQLVGVKFALDNWRRRALSAEEKPSRCCETCRHLRSGVPCMVCELLRLHVHGETTKTFSCSQWEACDDTM